MSIWQEKSKINQWILEACTDNGMPELFGKIRWQFNAKFRSRAGDANCHKMFLRFSLPIWLKATEEQKQDTVKHETCHLVAWVKYGPHIKSHGVEWQQTMIKAGLEPKRTHSVPVIKRSVDVQCTKCKQVYKLGLIRARRMLSGKSNYLCRQCHATVEFV